MDVERKQYESNGDRNEDSGMTTLSAQVWLSIANEGWCLCMLDSVSLVECWQKPMEIGG